MVLDAAEEREVEGAGRWVEVILAWGTGRDTMGSERRRYAPRVSLPPTTGGREEGQGTEVPG